VSKRTFPLVYIFGFLTLTFLTWLGWGFWGYGFWSDHVNDYADGLRLLKGDVPFRDFIPHLGVLNAFVVRCLLPLGQWAHSSIYLITVGIVLALWIAVMKSGCLPKPGQQWLFTGLYISVCVFPSTNGQYIQGYSQMGVTAGVLFALTLYLLRSPLTDIRCAIASITLALVYFTKIDLMIPALGAAFLILLLPLTSRQRLIWITCNVALWFSINAILVLAGSKINLLVESTVECFFAASWAHDDLLRQRMMMLGSVLVFTSFLLGLLRKRGWTKVFDQILIVLVPVAILLDIFRGENDPTKEQVIFRYLLFSMTIWNFSKIGRISLRYRLRFLRHLKPQWVLIYCISLCVFLRVYTTGWYPVGYCLPFVLLIMMNMMPLRRGSTFSRILYPVLFAVTMVLLVRTSIHILRLPKTSLVATPWGEIRTLEAEKNLIEAARIIKQYQGIDSAFCTYPSLPVLLGLRSVNYHPFLHRLGIARPQREQEERTLDIVKQRRPEIMYLINEGSEQKPLFGSDYGKNIFEYCETHYNAVWSYGKGFDPHSRKDGGTLYIRSDLKPLNAIP
jgi:hypothetical protein